MKTLKLFLLIGVSVLLTVSCKKNEETPVLDATTEEAATIMATSFCTGNAGTMTQIEDAVELSQSATAKTTLTDSSFTISSVPGAPITYQYQVEYSYGFQTSNNYLLAYDAAGSYNSANLSANITAGGSLNVTGFLTGNNLIVNGQSGRTGNFAMKIGNKNSITGTVSTVVTNFTFNKTTLVCESGTATCIVNGTTSAGRSFSFTGTLVYSGNYVASLTISGKTYSLNVSTGVITK
jgi:hypothetical protein